MLRRFFTVDDQHQFKPQLIEIEEEPQNPLGRIIFWTIIISVLFFGCWMFWGQVDVVVSARGKVIPRGEVKVVQPLTTGVVRRILVEEGQLVRKGTVLMEIDPSQTEPELESMRVNLEQLTLEIERINALLGGYAFTPPTGFSDELVDVQQRIYASSKQRMLEQIGIKREQLKQVRQQVAALNKQLEQQLYERDLRQKQWHQLERVKDIVSRQDYFLAQKEYKQAQSAVGLLEHQLYETQAVEQQVGQEMALIKEEEQNRLLSGLADKRREHVYLQAKIEQATFVSARQLIVAPVDGYIHQLLIHTVGGVVTPAEKLISIVPSDSPLIIKALIESKDSGFVEEGMDVMIKLDTFSFQKYGTLDGRVTQVSRDSLEHERLGLVYELMIDPLQTSLLVEGQYMPLATGMGVTVEVKTGMRRIIEFFIYPLIKYLDEGISVR